MRKLIPLKEREQVIPNLYTHDEIKQANKDDKKTKLYPGRAFDLNLPFLDRMSLPRFPSPNPRKSATVKQRNELIRKNNVTPLKIDVSEYKLEPKARTDLKIERIP